MSKYLSIYNRDEELRQLEQHIEQLKRMVTYEIGIKSDNPEATADLTQSGAQLIRQLNSFLATVKLYENP